MQQQCWSQHSTAHQASSSQSAQQSTSSESFAADGCLPHCCLHNMLHMCQLVSLWGSPAVICCRCTGKGGGGGSHRGWKRRAT